MTTDYEQAEQYADYTVLLYSIDQQTDALHLDTAHKVAMIIELDTYEALSVRRKDKKVERLEEPKYCQLSAIWLHHCLGESYTEKRIRSK